MPLRQYGVEQPLHEIKAELFKALAHPVRVRALELLADGERPVSELLAETGMEASHLSQHLSVLRRAGVVTSRRAGKTVLYRVAGPAVIGLLRDARTVLVESYAHTAHALEGPTDAPGAGTRTPGTRTTDTVEAGR